MKEDEKIIYVYTPPDTLSYIDCPAWEMPLIILLTNHAKLMCYYRTISLDKESKYYFVMVDYNFLIPKDYINIMKKLTQNITCFGCTRYSETENGWCTSNHYEGYHKLYENISNLLRELKSSLYYDKRKLEDEYQEKLEKINNDKHTLQLEKEYFNINIQAYADLKRDREILDKNTQSLEIEKDKIKNEYENLKQSLEIEKEDYEKRRQALEIEKKIVEKHAYKLYNLAMHAN
jgi:hypothetical protein